MSFALDREIALALEGGPARTPRARGDVQGLRLSGDQSLAALDSLEPAAPDVVRVDHRLPVDGGEIRIRWYERSDCTPGSAVVFCHGGGMVGGSIDVYDRHVAAYVQRTAVPFLAVDYRLAPEHPGTTLVEDCFAAVLWLREHASELGVAHDRIAVMGDSGGGGVAAGLAIAARDRSIPLARQILIYPMLDHRNTVPDPELVPFANWTYDDNFTAWRAVLGDRTESSVSPLASPAVLEDFRGLAPAFIDVGELDIFRDEGVSYAMRLNAAGVSAELHLRPGAVHAFDRFARTAQVSIRSWNDRYSAVESLSQGTPALLQPS